ncbi:MAG: DUF4126 family protein [Chloroflexi bacterium]|nr:DUF4126 family protein [Chloroflexota bacterium]
MLEGLLLISRDLGLGVALGFQPILTLALAAAAARLGVLALQPPLLLLSDDRGILVLGGLLVVALIGQRLGPARALMGALETPLALAAAALLFATQTSPLSALHPGFAATIGLLTAGSVRAVHWALRSITQLPREFPVLGPTLGSVGSVLAALGALLFTATALAVPVAVPLVALVTALVGMRLALSLARSIGHSIGQALDHLFGEGWTNVLRTSTQRRGDPGAEHSLGSHASSPPTRADGPAQATDWLDDVLTPASAPLAPPSATASSHTPSDLRVGLIWSAPTAAAEPRVARARRTEHQQPIATADWLDEVLR